MYPSRRFSALKRNRKYGKFSLVDANFIPNT